MMKLPKLIKRYITVPLIQKEEVVLALLWIEFKLTVRSHAWLNQPFEYQYNYCDSILGRVFMVPSLKYGSIVQSCQKRVVSPEAKAKSEARKAAKVLQAFWKKHQPMPKVKHKHKRQHEPRKVVPKQSPAVILRKNSGN